MNLSKFIFLSSLVIIINNAFAFFSPQSEDDTIRIKTNNNVNINIIAEDSIVILNNINEIIFQTESQLNNLKKADNKIDSSLFFFNSEQKVSSNEDDVEEPPKDNFVHRFWNLLLLKNLNYNIYNEDKIVKYSFFLDLGLINYLDKWKIPISSNSQYALSPLSSFNLNLGGNLRLRLVRNFSLNIDASYGWNFYSYKDRSTIILAQNNEITYLQRVLSYNNDYSFEKSQLIVPSLDVSLLPVFHIFHYKKSVNPGIVNYFNMRLGIGVFAAYRFRSTAKYRYTVDDIEMRYSDKDLFYINKFNHGIKAIIGFGNYFDIYFKYYLNPMYEKGKSTSLNTFSLGFRISI